MLELVIGVDRKPRSSLLKVITSVFVPLLTYNCSCAYIASLAPVVGDSTARWKPHLLMHDSDPHVYARWLSAEEMKLVANDEARIVAVWLP